MAEYVMGPDDDQQDVARKLHEHAGPDRAHEIAWYPRPDVPGGGVFSMPDDLADGFTSSRLSRLDTNTNGERIRLATEGTTAEQRDPTEHNQKIAAGEAPTAASPATGANPVAHLPEQEGDGTEPKQTARQRRAAAKSAESGEQKG